MASYEEILVDLCSRTEASESPESMRKILMKHESTGIAIGGDGNRNGNGSSVPTSENESEDQEQVVPQLLPFHPRGLADLVVTRMMMTIPIETESNKAEISSTQAMTVARALVECLPEVYIQSLATSVSDLVASVSHEKISIGNDAAPGLLRLWVSLITRSPLAVHELLSESLITLVGKQQQAQEQAKDALDYFVEDWKVLLESKSNSSEAVRCAVFVVKWVSRLPFGLSLAKSSGATDLFVKMLGDFDDPLQQLSLLDALIQEFDATSTSSDSTFASLAFTTITTSPTSAAAATDEWLVSPPLMSLVLQFLKDPILSDAALRYVGVLTAFKPTEMAIVLDHVREVVAVQNGGDVPTRDTERLPLVNALSTVCMSSEAGLDSILSDPLLRRAWWDTDRIAQPKLKAAILVSIAQALPAIEASFGSSRALELYRKVGEDHQRESSYDDDTTTTTLWLLTKMATSPLIEVKISSMALLAAALRIQNASMTIVGRFDKASHSTLLELLLSPKREPTVHAQSARYDLLTAFLEALKAHPSLEENPKILQKLDEKLALGPHGQKALQHGTDEMETA